MEHRWPWAIAATCCAPMSLRIAALASQAAPLAAIDLRGFASDLAMALFAAVLLVGLTALHRGVALLFALVWSVGHYANYETVRVLGAPASLREIQYLFDPTFAVGSALALSSPWLFGLLTVTTLLLATAGTRAALVRGFRVAGAGVGLALVVALWPDAPEQPAWRQANFLQRDLSLATRLALAPPPESEFADPPSAMLARWPELAANLDGTPRLLGDARARNVLLVVLESVSGVHLESFAREHGRPADASMPKLDALAEQSLRYVSFIAPQRKTNRGLYALLCGELPNLGAGTPKMSAAAEAPWRVCLPDVLRTAGYQTAYLQAAPLAFMLKDRFLPRAGFDSVLGSAWFEHSYTRSAWGVDDRAFFEQAERRIAELREGESPWFLTLLTVGTHHPYLVPEDFGSGRRSFRQAAAYLDAAFGRFLERLERDAALDDTLLVVISDESAGVAGFETQPAFKMLSQNWGILLLRGPGVAAGVVRDPYGLVDLPLSIADYLGLGPEADHFFGRSVLRRYEAARHLFFGNGNLGSLGMIEARDALLVCGSSGDCRRHRVSDRRFFGMLPEPATVPAEDDAVVLLRDLAVRSAPSGVRRPRSYELLREPEVRLTDDRPQMLHGGQFVQLEPGEWLEVEYEVELLGDAGVEVDLMHGLTAARNEGLLRRRTRLTSGQRLQLRYRYAPESAADQLQCRTTVRLVAGESALLRHTTARMRIRRGAERPADGVQLDRFEVSGD